MNAFAAVLVAPRTFAFQEFPIPAIDDDDGILRIEACGLCGTDYDQWRGEQFSFGTGMPIIPGHEIIGTIERLGTSARYRWGVDVGDRVTVEGVIPCGMCAACTSGAYKRCSARMGYGLKTRSTVPPGLWGGYATHLYLHPRSLIHRLPADIPTGVMALYNPLSNAVRWACEIGGVGLGSRVVICGPGQRGLLAVFAAREAGASQIIVTGTARDADRLAVAREFGATTTIDVDATDPVSIVREVTQNRLADVVLDVSSGATAPIVQAVDMVRAGGRIVLAGLKGRTLDGLHTDTIVSKEVQLVGAFSAGWSAIEASITLVRHHEVELKRLVTHAYPLLEAQQAMRVLGREIRDGPPLLNAHLSIADIR